MHGPDEVLKAIRDGLDQWGFEYETYDDIVMRVAEMVVRFGNGGSVVIRTHIREEDFPTGEEPREDQWGNKWGLDVPFGTRPGDR